jgi:hypothetical protein
MSPASATVDTFTPNSLKLFPAGELIAFRIKGGAAAEPRRNDELAS